MLTPTRYLWSHYDTYFKGRTFKVITKPVVGYLKYWDKIAANRPDKIIAISTEVQKRVKKYYNRESEVIFPPTNIINHQPLTINNKRSYFLYVGRLVGYKKVDILVDVFNKLGKKLVIVGTGHQKYRLRLKSKKNIKFLKNVSDKKLKKIYLGAKALIMPQEEDFGLVSVEAQSFGTPVIAYAKGGVKDTVINGKTGILYFNQTVEGLLQAIAKFEKISFNHKYIVKNAKRFSEKRFKRELQRSLIRAYFGRRGRDASLAKIKK